MKVTKGVLLIVSSTVLWLTVRRTSAPDPTLLTANSRNGGRRV
jgi:hypothetical protein